MKSTKLVLAMLSIFGVFLLNFSNSPLPENTGAPSELTCGRAPCHNIPANAGTAQVEILVNEGDTSYQMNESKTITISFEPTNNLNKNGFQILALDENNQNVGSWILTNPTQMEEKAGLGLPSRKYVTHLAAGNSQNSWTLDWQAPSQDAGSVTFYASVLDADNNGNNQGDSLYTVSNTLTFAEPVSTFEEIQDLFLHTYPNPASDYLVIENALEQSLELQIVDIQGRLIQAFQIAANRVEINVSDWNPGLYILKSLTKEHTISRRIIIR